MGLEHLDIMADKRKRVASVARVDVHLAAAGLRLRKLHAMAEPLEQPHGGLADAREQRVG
jgi:hypothetical protein